MRKLLFGHSGESASQLISKADAAREIRDWTAAADAYGGALKIDPSLAAIWVQYGHALKESGQLDAAEKAYRQSIELEADVADTHLQLGHVLKTKGALHEARTAYERSVQIDSNSFAKAELSALAQLNIHGHDQEDAARQSAWIFDCSDLVQYLRDNRILTGIQRVQVNIVKAIFALAGDHPASKIVYFDIASRSWKEINQVDFQRLVNSAGNTAEVSDSAWGAIRNQICESSEKGQFSFVNDDALINLGTSWWIPDYFLRIRTLKIENGVRYVPFIHDCIPLITPEYCDPGLVRQFTNWITRALRYADAILVNSESTASDLRAFASRSELSVPEVTVVRLDGNILDASVSKASADSRLRARNLLKEMGIGSAEDKRSDFVLMVATLEARKNHLLAFRIWKRLIDDYGLESVPHLVCIGKEGWKFSEASDFLKSHSEIADRVSLISGIADNVLAELYKSCRFTIFPSHYEGWGLPVTESLCFCRIPVVARVSALPEAGGEFAEYFDPLSMREAYTVIERLIFDHSYRSEREANIANRFRARSWDDIALDVVRTIEGLPRSAEHKDSRTEGLIEEIRLGSVYTFATAGLTVGDETSGGNYRLGNGWDGPEEWGSWTGSSVAEILCRLPERVESGNLCFYVCLKSPTDRDVPFSVTFAINSSRTSYTFDVGRVEDAWLRLVFPVEMPARELRVSIRNSKLANLAGKSKSVDDRYASNLARKSEGADDRDVADLARTSDKVENRYVGCGIAGFALALEDDIRSRVAVLEQLNGITTPTSSLR
jgi:glycosyltransferase involved in cell wall biosynthesis